MDIKEAKKALEAAQSHYLAIESAAPAKDRAEASAKVKDARAAIMAAITEGALPCPISGLPPIGMEQPSSSGRGFEYEIGSGFHGVKPFRHSDGSIREPRVRGGLLPKHAVEAWNAGPDYWLKAKDQNMDDSKLGPSPADAAKKAGS